MTALFFIRTYWRPIVGAGILALLAVPIAALLITRATLASRTVERDQARHALQDQIENYRTAASEAETRARATDARNEQIRKETQDALESQLADARARAADYANRLSGAAAQADPDSGTGRLPSDADPSSHPNHSGPQTVLADDLAICSENTVKAQGWADWWELVGLDNR